MQVTCTGCRLHLEQLGFAGVHLGQVVHRLLELLALLQEPFEVVQLGLEVRVLPRGGRARHLLQLGRITVLNGPVQQAPHLLLLRLAGLGREAPATGKAG